MTKQELQIENQHLKQVLFKLETENELLAEIDQAYLQRIAIGFQDLAEKNACRVNLNGVLTFVLNPTGCKTYSDEEIFQMYLKSIE